MQFVELTEQMGSGPIFFRVDRIVSIKRDANGSYLRLEEQDYGEIVSESPSEVMAKMIEASSGGGN